MKKAFALLFVLLTSTPYALAENPAECLTRIDALGRFTSNVDGWSDRPVGAQEVRAKLGLERDLRYTAILTKEGLDFSETELFTNKADLTIGISTSGNTQGHTYVIVDNQRIDGRMFWAYDTVIKDDWKFSKGMIIRYKSVPQSTKDRLIAWLNKGKSFRTATCVATGCKLLYDVAKFQNPPSHYYWFPSNLLKHLAKTGLVTEDGIRLEPEIYTLNADITSLWNNLPNAIKAPGFIAQVFLDPYTWAGSKNKNAKPLKP